MAAHRDDPVGAPVLGGQHREEAHCAVTDDHDCLAWLHVGRVGSKPGGAHHVGESQQACRHVVRWNVPGGHQRAVRERDAQHGRLRIADELAVLAARRVTSLAVGTGVVGGEE